MFLKINNICLLLVFAVGAVHSIHDPAYTGIKTQTYRRDPQIAQAFQQQQQLLNNHQLQQQQVEERFTANQYQQATNYHQSNDGDVSERLSLGVRNQNKLQHLRDQQQQQQQRHDDLQQQSVDLFPQELPIYDRNQGRDGSPSLISSSITNSNWDDAENAITDYYTGCPAHFTGHLPYSYDCRRFLNCWNGRGHIQSCSPGTVFNPDTLECDRPDKVVCAAAGRRPQNNADIYRSGRLVADANVEQVPVLCPAGVTGLHPHPTDCSKFLNCANGNVHIGNCGPGTAYSIPMMLCDYREKVDCGRRDDSSIQISPRRDVDPTYVNINRNKEGGTHDGIMCPAGVSGLFPYPFDHGKFMNCKRGNTAIQNCEPGTMFSISKRFCESSNVIDAYDHVAHTMLDKDYEYSQSVITCPPGMTGEYLFPYDCQRYLSCLRDQRMVLESCFPGMVYSHTERGCLPKQQVPAMHRVAEEYRLEDTQSSSDLPLAAKSSGGNSIVVTCPPNGSGLYPYPFDCGKYLRCRNGEIIVEVCPAGSVFSLSLKRCDLKERVDDSHRVAFTQYQDSDQQVQRQEVQESIQQQLQSVFDSGEGLTCPPGMDGLFLHPFDCTAYLKCHQGQRSIEHCRPGTVFSISKQACVGSAQVNSFDRVDYSAQSQILSQSSSQTASSTTQPIAHNQWTPHLANDRTEFARGAGDGHAEVICPAGVTGLRPHPYDCTKFLRCTNGRTQIQKCGPGTAWDSPMEVCVLRDQATCGVLQSWSDTATRTVARDYTHDQSAISGMQWSQLDRRMEQQEVACAPGLNGLYPHPFDCTKYLNCRDGRTIVQNCVAGSVFSISKRFCELKEDVENADRVSYVHEYGHELMEESERETHSQTGGFRSEAISCPAGATGFHLHPFDCTKYLKCERGRAVVYACPFGMVFSLSRKHCVIRNQVTGRDHVGTYTNQRDGMEDRSVAKEWNNPDYNPNRGAQIECPEGASGIQPHPYDCKKFLQCANGVAHVQECGPGTAWNKAMEVCDFEGNVACSDRNQNSNSRGAEQHGYQIPDFSLRPGEPPSNFNHQRRPPTSQTVSTTSNNNQRDTQHDRWTSMHMSRPVSSPPHANAQPPFSYQENADSQQTVSSNSDGSTWTATDAGSSVHLQQSGREGAFNLQGTSVHSLDRNHAHGVYKYATPLAPFSPQVGISPVTSQTHVPHTDRQYGQRVGSHQDSQELFDNISGGDLSPVKPNTYGAHGRRIDNGKATPAEPWTPTVVHSTFPSSPYSPIRNQNLSPPHTSSDFHSYSQHTNNSFQTQSIDEINYQGRRDNVQENGQAPITDSLQFSESEQNVFNAAAQDKFPSEATHIYRNLLPPEGDGNDKLQRTLPHVSPIPNNANNANLYEGLQPPKPTLFSHTSTTPESYLRTPLNPTVPLDSFNIHRENEQAPVYQVYPSIRNESIPKYVGDPHYSSSYSGVTHSHNASWSRNLGIKGHQTNMTLSPTTPTVSRSDEGSFSSPTTQYGLRGPTYNHEYYKTSTPTGESVDPGMEKLPISDALRMLLHPYMNRNSNVSDEAVVRAESHIMNLALTTSTTKTPPVHEHPTRTGENEDDVELIFTDEQHGMVTAATKKNSTTITRTTRTEFYPSASTNPRDYGNSYESSQKPTRNDEESIRQGKPHSLPKPSIPEDRSISNLPHDSNWQNHNHHLYHNHHSQHDIDFHKRHHNIPNPFETTTTTTAFKTSTKDVDVQLQIPSDVYNQGINGPYIGVDPACPFDCGNNKCVNDSEVCDGVNDCGNRQDEAQCDHLDYEVRLADGENANSGRVEVKILGKWGYVCDDKFGLLDADVVCKELGFNLGANEVRGNSFYSPSETDFSFVMDEVECSGNETSLKECDFKGWGVNNCGPDEVVGVVCKVPLLKCPNNYWLCSESKECIPPAFVCDNTPDCADKSDESVRVCNSPIEYRLEGGRGGSEGRVEVMYRGEWGSVCDDDFGLNEAQVLCNSLGFHGKPKIEKNIFGLGSGPIWLDQVSCFGNESAIDKCSHWTWGEHNCNHTEDVGIRCTAGPPPKSVSSVIAAGNGGQQLLDSDETQQSIEDFTLEDIGLYTGQWQRSSKLINRNFNQKRCGHFKPDLHDEYEHPEERVVNGTLAKRGHHPWQATIRTKGRGGISSHWCGAVLISKKHLLTAAHCLVGYPKGAYFIRMGDHYATIAESSETNSYIENWYIHEKFRDKTHMNNDIALIVLKNPVRFNDYVQPICLPEKGASLKVNRLCTISGWGSIKSGVSTPSNILRAAQLPILSDETCKQPHVYGSTMTEGMFCAGSMDESVDACDGDSGGPLVCSDEDGETLYGIISWGQQCGFANKPGVYVRVEKYIDWIYEKINFSMQQTIN